MKNINLLLFVSLFGIILIVIDRLFKLNPLKNLIFDVQLPLFFEAGEVQIFIIRILSSDIRPRPLLGFIEGIIDEHKLPLVKLFKSFHFKEDFFGQLLVQKRGVYNFAKIVLSEQYPFALSKRDYPQNIKKTIFVYPRLLNIKVFAHHMKKCLRTGPQFQRLNDVPFIPKTPRPYNFSDPLNKINWRMYARTKTFLVFDEENNSLEKLRVHLNASFFKDEEEYEYALRIIVSLIFYCKSNYLCTEFYLDNKRFFLDGKSQEAINDILAFLCKHSWNPNTLAWTSPYTEKDFLLLPCNLSGFFAGSEAQFKGVVIWVGKDSFVFENQYLNMLNARTKRELLWKLD
ncbi:DUF58 domain-containing protein [Candidatus Riflebacteria bacterium]